MSSRRETILAAAKAALTSVTGVTDASVYRDRVAALTRADSPAIIVEAVSDTADNPNTYRLEWTLLFSISVIFRDSVPDQAADDTITSVHSKIMGNSTLNNLCANLLPTAVSWQFIEADKTVGIVVMQYKAQYQTSLNDLTS
jgi:hypothetical protein